MRWLNRERLNLYPRIFLAVYILAIIILLGLAFTSGSGLSDFMGRPIGTDFSCYWMASKLVVDGRLSEVYNFQKFLAAQRAYFGSDNQFPWLYPPTFLLIITPLAALPYLASLTVWLALTLRGFLEVLRRMAPHPLTTWLALAFPGTFQATLHGQNGFFSASLLGGGLLLLDRHPFVGGFLMGLLSYKPHLMPLVPIALIAGKRWLALTACMTAALALAGASYLVFGWEVWASFLRNVSLPMEMVKTGIWPVNKMVTIFAGTLQLGAGIPLALCLHSIVALAVSAAVFWVWKRPCSLLIRSSILTLGSLLFTPYAYSYDLALLAIPLACIGWEGYIRGWMRGEKTVLFLGWIIPSVATASATIHLPFAPIVLLVLFIFAVKRGMSESVFHNWERRNDHEAQTSSNP